MSRFGPDPRAFFGEVYRDSAPWDVGGAQPALKTLLEAHPPADTVLDVGCGTGDLAIAIARSGRTVVGVDFAEGAIHQAREKLAGLPPDVAARLEFLVADALRPAGLGRTFGAVVDSGFFHLFEPTELDPFVEELATVLPPGGRYYLLAFATTFPNPNMPRAVPEAELRERFSAERGWRILELRDAEFQSRIAPVPAVVACFERAE
jgi:ubiquinone/menaquinone biosynthesis C-methylase UbiE